MKLTILAINLIIFSSVGWAASDRLSTTDPDKATLDWAEAHEDTDTGEVYIKLLDFSNKGNPRAESMLGVMFQGGVRGIRKDLTRAFNLLNRAAQKGDFSGELNVGLMYKDGEGVDKNNAMALYLERQALTQAKRENKKDVALIIAHIYEDGGYGINQDIVMAWRIYNAVAENKSFQSDDCQSMGGAALSLDCVAALNRDTISSKMTQEEMEAVHNLPGIDINR